MFGNRQAVPLGEKSCQASQLRVLRRLLPRFTGFSVLSIFVSFFGGVFGVWGLFPRRRSFSRREAPAAFGMVRRPLGVAWCDVEALGVEG